jgi:hypothetical protein
MWSETGTGTYFFCVLGQGRVFLDGELDGLGVGDFQEGESDDLGHRDDC